MAQTPQNAVAPGRAPEVPADERGEPGFRTRSSPIFGCADGPAAARTDERLGVFARARDRAARQPLRGGRRHDRGRCSGRVRSPPESPTSTPHRTTASASPSDASGARSRSIRATSACCRRRSGGLLEPNDRPNPGDDLEAGFAVPARWTRRWDFTRDGVLRSLDESRRRLGRDRIDVVFIHDPDDHMDEALDSALPTLVELRAAGVVGAIGAGMNSASLLARFVETGVVDVVLLAGRYTLLEQERPRRPASPPPSSDGIVRRRRWGFQLWDPRPATMFPADTRYNYVPAPAQLRATSPPARGRVPRTIGSRCRPRRCSSRSPTRPLRACWSGRRRLAHVDPGGGRGSSSAIPRALWSRAGRPPGCCAHDAPIADVGL